MVTGRLCVIGSKLDESGASPPCSGSDTMKKNEPTPLPMYVFTGFLESGKTKFIQQTLEDPRFNAGERTLLLVLRGGRGGIRPLRLSASRLFGSKRRTMTS